VATVANSNQVSLTILTRLTPKLLMMHFEVGHYSAALTSPTIPPQDRMTKLIVLLLFQANWSSLIDPR
jgi:hypothetical protein